MQGEHSLSNDLTIGGRWLLNGVGELLGGVGQDGRQGMQLLLSAIVVFRFYPIWSQRVGFPSPLSFSCSFSVSVLRMA